jgi:hypothetical protein
MMNMKRNVFWLAMLAMVLTFGMTAVGCDDGGGNSGGTDPFAGTWEMVGDAKSKIVAANGSFESSWDGKVLSKGTYTCEGNNVTATLTHLNPWMFGGDDQLYTWAALPQEYKDPFGSSPIFQMTVTGNTLSANGETFTKQGTQSNTDPFAGTWVWAENGQKIIAADGSWNWYDDQNNVVASGTYTTSGNNVTLSKHPENNIYTTTISGNTVSIPITANDGTPVTAILTKQGSGNSVGNIAGVWINEAFRMTIVQNGGAFTYELEYDSENVWFKMEKGSIALNGNSITFTVMGFWFRPADPSVNGYWIMENEETFDYRLGVIHGGNKTYSGTIAESGSTRSFTIALGEQPSVVMTQQR